MSFKYISMKELESCRNRFNCVTLEEKGIEGTYFFEIDPDTANVRKGRVIPSVAYRGIREIYVEKSDETKLLTVEVKNPKILEAIANVVEVDPRSIDNLVDKDLEEE